MKGSLMPKPKNPILSLLFALFAIGLIQAGCGKSEPESAGKAAPDKKAKSSYTIGMSQCNLGEPWRVEMNAQLKAAADKHPNLQVIFKDAQNDTLKQRAHVEEFVSAGVDLIIISPKEAQPLTEPVAKAMDAGIPVIVLDRSVLGDKYSCFIGADNKKIGHAAGEWIVKKLGGKGKLVELKGLMTSTPGQDRDSGFREALAGSGIEIVFDADMKWLEPNARQEMESALARFNKIDCVYAHNDPGAHGAYLAAKAAGREKEMLFVGIDALPQEGVAYVQQDILSATFQYPTGAAEAIDTALKIFNGETVPKKITLGSRVFDKDTIAQGGRALD
jgi:ribose transport system substrate-binding protein